MNINKLKTIKTSRTKNLYTYEKVYSYKMYTLTEYDFLNHWINTFRSFTCRQQLHYFSIFQSFLNFSFHFILMKFSKFFVVWTAGQKF